MTHPSRIHTVNRHPVQHGHFVLYWIQSAPRVRFNHALSFSIEKANELGLPLVAYFQITDSFPDANLRHYTFLFQGLNDAQKSFEKYGIPLVVGYEKSTAIPTLSQCIDQSALVITDGGYLKFHKERIRQAASYARCPLFEIETNVVVPVETASNKEEYSAFTLRKKMTPVIDQYLTAVELPALKNKYRGKPFPSLAISNIQAACAKLSINSSVQPVSWITGGEQSAQHMLDEFIAKKLNRYETYRNDPSKDGQSHMSPYLHFGHISPLDIALRIKHTNAPKFAKDALFEELIIRRELAINFVHYNKKYYSYDSLPDWAKKTLRKHSQDKRSYHYSAKQLEQGETHDLYWNAAQREMTKRGKMHGYMRMYWGKKIIEWSKSPEDAYKTALYLNNMYELDGRDPNGYAGIAWCFGKHDRPWTERPIFGSVRFMNADGLKRKFDRDGYVKNVETIKLP